MLSSEPISKLTCSHTCLFLVLKPVSPSAEMPSNPYVLSLPPSSTLLISFSTLCSKPSLFTGFSISFQDIHLFLGSVFLHLLSSLSLFVTLAPIFGRAAVTCDISFPLHIFLQLQRSGPCILFHPLLSSRFKCVSWN